MRYVFAGLVCLTVAPFVQGQSTFATGVLITDEAATTKGSRVAVRLADPFANAKDEIALRQLLAQPYKLQWNASTPLRQVTRDLSRYVRFAIDFRALEEIGLTSNVTYGSEPKQFASTGATPPAKPETTDKWWTSSSTVRKATTRSIGSQLFFILDQLDLTINYKAGQWMITTIEAAECSLQTRLFDVTPLIEMRQSNSRARSHSTGFGMGPDRSGVDLIEAVQTHIEPDTWDVLGGPSTISAVVVQGKHSLAISTTPLVHWQIEAFLNQLNGVR